VSGANGSPNARADTGGSGTVPLADAFGSREVSDALGHTRAGHAFDLGRARAGNEPGQGNLVHDETSAGCRNVAAVDGHANLDDAAMAAGGRQGHVPAAVERGRSCGQNRSDDCESGRQSEGAHTIASHASPHNCVVPGVSCGGFPAAAAHRRRRVVTSV